MRSLPDDIFTRVEELHPDLEPYAGEGVLGWPVLQHPLVYAVPLTSNAYANWVYAEKRKAVAEALEERRLHLYIYLHERPYRIEAFRAIAHLMGDAEYWETLGNIWTDSENIWQNLEEWQEALTSERPCRTAIMSPEDQAVLEALPDTIHVYRGARTGFNEDGLSWTLSRDRAQWFALRGVREDDDEPVVIHGRVQKEDVVGYFSGRNEAEIVVADPEDVTVICYVEVGEEPSE